MKGYPFQKALVLSGTLAGPLGAADWAKLPSTVPRYNDWSYQFAWTSPYVTPNAPGVAADFSKQNYTVKNDVFLNGNKAVGTLKLGDTLGDPTFVQQTSISPGSPATSSLVLDNLGAGALIDTLASTVSPPLGAEFGIPKAANEIRAALVLNDNLTININTGPTSISSTRWAGLNILNHPVTETGGARHITIDGNGRGITSFTAGSSHSGGTLVKAGTVSTGGGLTLGSGPITVNSGGQCTFQGKSTLSNSFSIAGTGVAEPAGDRGALFFGAYSDVTVSGGITLTSNSRIEGARESLTTLAGALAGSSNLELNALVQPEPNEPRTGNFVLTGSASAFTGKITVSRGYLTLGPASNPGGAMDVSRSAGLGGETTLGGTLRLGTSTPDSGVSTLLNVNPVSPGALHANGNLVLTSGSTTVVQLDGLPPGPTVKILTYGGTLTGTAANFDLVGGMAAYRPGTAFDTTGSPGEILLNVTRGNVVWNTGSGNWDTTSTNWVGGEAFHFLDDATFDDTGAGGLVTILGDLRAGTILVNNSPATPYIFNADNGNTGSPLNNSIATGTLVKNGAGKLTIGTSNGASYNQNTFNGGTTILQGAVEVLQNGDAGITSGPLGTGIITLNGGALFGTSSLNLTLYNDLVIDNSVTLGDASATQAFNIAGHITLGGNFTLNTPSDIGLGKNNDASTGMLDHGMGYSFIKTGAGLLDFPTATTNSWGGSTTIANGALRMRGSLNCASLAVSPGATLTGNGSVNCPVTVASGATISASTDSTNTFILTLTLGAGLDLDGTYLCDFDATAADRVHVAGALDLTNASLQLNSLASPSSAAYVIASYGSRVGAFANITGLPPGYQIDYAYNDGSGPNHIAVVIPTPFQKWSQARGLTAGINDGPSDDPNHDGTNNLAHFAFDTDPLGPGGNEGKQRLEIATDGGSDRYFTLTLPVRKNAVFSGSPPQASIGGIVYRIPGDDDLSGPRTLGVTVVSPAHDSSLPALGDYDGTAGADWEYRSFRLTESIAARPAGFLIPEASAAP